MKLKSRIQHLAVLTFLMFAAVLAQAGTWSTDQMLGLNANPMVDWDKTWVYRNLALQGRNWAPLSDPWSETVTVPLKGSSDANPGYPVAGESAVIVVVTQLTADNAGTYQISVQGNNPPVRVGDGSMTTPVYSQATNRTTATLTIPPSISNGMIALQFNTVTADFGDLKVMQPGYSVDDTKKLSVEATAHYSRARVIRAMDRLKTNGSTDVNWSGSVAAGKGTLLGYQHSLKAAMDLAAAADAHAWVNVPAMASDAYLQSFMGVIATNIKPYKIAVVELSNEPWNSQFLQFSQLRDASFIAGRIQVGKGDATTGKILSIERRSGVVIVKLDTAHGLLPGQQIYQEVDTTDAWTYPTKAIKKGVVTLVSGTTGKTLKFSQAGDDYFGVIDTNWYNSWLALEPANELVAPLTTYGKPNDWMMALCAKSRYELTRMRAIYDAAVTAGIEGRVRIVKGTVLDQYGYYCDAHSLAWGKEKYGSMDWLFAMGGGIAPAYYMLPADFYAMDTVDGVFSQLDQARLNLRWDLIKLRNLMASLGQSTINGYEAGPHTHLKPTQAIADAVQIAHRDDPRMATLLADQYHDWVNLGGGPLMYFHGGATTSYGGISFGGTNNNTWALREGTLASSGNAVKDVFFTNEQSASSAPAGVVGMTRGTIPIVNVYQWQSGTGGTNGLLKVDPDTKVTRFPILVVADSAGTYNVALDAGTTGGVNMDTASIYVDGQLLVSGFLVESNPWTEHPGQAMARSVELAAGAHTVEVVLDAFRNGYVGLYQLHFD